MSPDTSTDPAGSPGGPRRTLVVLLAATLSVAAIAVGLIAAGHIEPSARVFEVTSGERRYWPPGVVRPGDQMRCHGELYELWHAGPDGAVSFGDTGITVGHGGDGSIIVTCPKELPEP